MQNTTLPQLLKCSDINNNNGDHLDRYLFPNNKVRYITVKANAYAFHDRNDILPSIPGGDWNWGTVARDPTTGETYLRNVIKKPLKGIKSRWHAKSFDHGDLGLYSGERNDSRIYMPAQRLDGRLIVVKLARGEDDIPLLQTECETYEHIQNRGIAPEFLGYVTEESRIVGFAIERFDSARTPTKGDADKCEAVLKRLNDLGFTHGDSHTGNFLVQDDRAFLIDLEQSKSMQDDVHGAALDIERIRGVLGGGVSRDGN
jgi:hypothetical protein